MTLGRLHYPDLDAAIEGTLAPKEIVDDLALVPVYYMDLDHRRAKGQLVLSKVLAGDIQEIFGEIRDSKFPIKSVIPIAHFGHDDAASIRHNNTSAFNYRAIAGTDLLSDHSYGKAIDINPWTNPYLKQDGSLMTPGIGDRSYDLKAPGTIVDDDPVVAAFTKRGWVWGGHWPKDRDYQHFDIDSEVRPL